MKRVVPVAVLVGVIAVLAPAARAEPPPNIVLILADDLGYADLGCCGSFDLRTPHLDRLAAEGIRFTAFYANCPVCSPTRAALLTGRFPDLAGVPGVIRTHADNSWGYLDPDAVLLPAALKPAGYHTAVIGKWHLGLEEPNLPSPTRGIDHFKGFLGDMMDDYFKHRRHGINYMREGGREIDPPGHATDLFSAWACDYLRARAGRDAPFFLYLAYNAPHVPIQPPPDWLEKVKKRDPAMTPKRAALAALIEHMDDGIGRVLATLRETGAAERTLVIFASDNGGQRNVGANNGPLNGTKGEMLEGGIRVPFIAAWPGRIVPGSTSGAVALTMDLYPTVCAAAGAAVPTGLDGRNMLPLLTGGTVPWPDRTLFWVRREGGNAYGGEAFYAARRGRWKLLQNKPSEPFRLYDLETDPAEARPLDPGHPQFAPLKAALDEHLRKASTVPWQPPEHRP